MKHLLRKHEALASEYEAEAYGFYEAKHTLTSPCAEGTLHRRSRLHFSYTLGCASFAPQFIQEIKKAPCRSRVLFEISTKVEIISSRTEVHDERP